MEEINEKILTKFRARCTDQAKVDKANLEAETENKIKEEVNKELEVYRSKLEKKKINAFEKLEKDYNNCVWELENIGKQKIISFEKECKDKILSELKEKMKEFVGSALYEKFLACNVKSAIDMLLEKENFTICVTHQDKEKYGKMLNEFSKNIDVLDDSMIGGCIIKSNLEIIDNTILTNLKEKINENENNL